MKKAILTIAAVAMAMFAFADNSETILDKIENCGKKNTTITGSLAQVRTTAAKAKINMSGTLYFTASNMFSILYSDPAGNKTVINNQSMLLVAKGKNQKFNLPKSPSMQKLASFLLDAMGGKVRNIANSNNASYTVSEEGNTYVVEMTARKKAAKGYSYIKLVYRQSDGVMTFMETREFSGVSNTYTLTDICRNSSIDKSVYSL